MIKIIISIAISLLFLGCSDSSDSDTTVLPNTGVLMQQDVLYPVESGNKVLKSSEPTRVTIVLDTNNEQVQVKVTEGSASLIK